MKKPSQIFDTPQATGFDRVTHNTREGIEEMIEQKSLSARDCLPDEEVINASQAVEIFHQELQKAREEERERIIKELRLASLIDAGGDGLVSVKMGMSKIEDAINNRVTYVIPTKESPENITESFEKILINALPNLRELTFHSDGSVIAKSGASAKKPKKLYKVHPKRNNDGTNAEPVNWEQLTKKAISKLIIDQSELDQPNK